MPKVNYCIRKQMSVCTALDDEQRENCIFFIQSPHKPKCIFYIFDEFCSSVQAQFNETEAGPEITPTVLGITGGKKTPEDIQEEINNTPVTIDKIEFAI